MVSGTCLAPRKERKINSLPTYDAEDRLINVNATAAVYSYDGEGRRVEKLVSNTRTFYIYDLAGRVISEFEASASASLQSTPEPVGTGVGEVRYNHTDHLGSSRVTTNASTAVMTRRDYYPFGREINPTADNQPKFTGELRDAETGLDYFGTRYYANTLGRFMSVDPGNPDPENPQSWNRYLRTASASLTPANMDSTATASLTFVYVATASGRCTNGGYLFKNG